MYEDTYTHHCNGHLADCLLDSKSPVIFIPSKLTGQAQTLRTQRVLQAVPHILANCYNNVPRSFEAEVFTGQMTFLSPKAMKRLWHMNVDIG